MILVLIVTLLFGFVIALLFVTATNKDREEDDDDSSARVPEISDPVISEETLKKIQAKFASTVPVAAAAGAAADAEEEKKPLAQRDIGYAGASCSETPQAQVDACGERCGAGVVECCEQEEGGSGGCGAGACCKDQESVAKVQSCGESCACIGDAPLDFAERAHALPALTILYGTQKGTSSGYAAQLAEEARARGWKQVEVVDMEQYDVDALMSEELVVMIAATYIEGTPTDSAKQFYEQLRDEANKPRGGNLLRTVAFAVFGLCNSLYADHFNVVGRKLNTWMARLGAARLLKLGVGDESADQDVAFREWSKLFWAALEDKERKLRARELEGVEDESVVDEDNDDEGDDAEPLLDIEDLGVDVPAPKPKRQKAKTSNDDDDTDSDEDYDLSEPPKDMLSSTHRKTLQKQGYKIIGTHSGVKLCRWTKSMLRGRGGCYKHTFYGIASHLCMEMTPSMACANKCVFCWRQHKNPVGREWRWNMDPPKMIIDGALERHRQMIKTCRGIPGVITERFDEAMNPRHCALSLVGEPIIYPEINEFLDYMHSHGISSFMVTNAQFPAAIETLRPVTQLYVSIDAGNEQSLKKIDRPLFKDFWQRFLDSIVALSLKGQRTVFRLTLVKGWNTEEITEYADLVRIGKPDFIEVKGVTYAGGGKRNQLTMKNVPWHEEVLQFCSDLCEAVAAIPDLPRYAVACEHEHSCCVLIANEDKFKRDGTWYTWIDFEKFNELIQTGEPFTSGDYMARTPDWGVIGHTQRGFDPEETRFRKVRNHKTSAADSDAEESYAGGGC